jgi:hydroxyacylglutathione hydrolase
VKIHAIPSGPIQTVGYLLTEARRGEAVLVDAPGGILERIQPLLAQEGCTLRELWLTHGHWDHMQQAAEIKEATGALVRAHLADRVMIEEPDKMEDFMRLRLGLRGVKVDEWAAQGDRLTALGLEFEVRHVPGHCPGNILFYLPVSATAGLPCGVALVGDALFNRGVGRWDFPGGSLDLLTRSIREQIYTLPDDTVVLPGHGSATTVGDEKEHNPYVTMSAP